MKVKLDEHLPRSLVARLAVHGIDADTVLDEGLGGQSAVAVSAAFENLVRHHDLSDLAETITVVHRGLLRIRR